MSPLQYKKKQSNVQVMGFDERYLEEFGITPAEGRAFQQGETMTAIAGSWVSQNFWDPTQTNYYGPPEALDLMNIQLDMVLADWIEVQQPSPFGDPGAATVPSAGPQIQNQGVRHYERHHLMNTDTL